MEWNEKLFTEIIRAGGSCTTQLSFSRLSDKQVRFLASYIERCGNLKELVYRSSNSDLISLSLPSQLSSLRLIYQPGKRAADAIALTSKRLRKLEFHFPHHDMEQLFASIGYGLEHLGVWGLISRQTFLLQVKTHCLKLQTLRIDQLTQDLSQAFVELLVSYSTQLKNVHLGDTALRLTRAQYQEVFRACPDLKCAVSCSWK